MSAYFEQKRKNLPDDYPDLANHQASIRNALHAVDALWPPISPAFRGECFPATELDKLNDLSSKLHEDMKELRKKMRESEMTTRKELVELDGLARRAANNTRALFAVHYIRNNCYVKNLRNGTVLARICEEIDRNYKPEQNAFAMAALISFVGAVVLSQRHGALCV